ncbi:MAG: hypothetical protein IKN12_04760 [Selenomonadaceae bacterium]|nr:hypothetical protein [Selenomonadaceae bacterium]
MMDAIKRAIKHNLPEKIIALFLSLILWLFVMENANPTIERSFTLPIEVAKVGDDYEYNLKMKQIKLTIAAKRIYFASLSSNKLRATVDLSESGSSGTFDAPILVEVPTGYEYIKKSADTVKVTLEPHISIPVPVEIRERGTLSPHMKILSVQKTDTMLLISGTREMTSKVSKLVGYVDLTGRTEDFEQEVALIPVDANGREVTNVKMLAPTTLVKVLTERNIITRRVNIAPDVSEPSLIVTVHPDVVEVTGDEKEIENLKVVKTEKISRQDFSNNNSIFVNLVLPKGVTAVNSVVAVTKK